MSIAYALNLSSTISGLFPVIVALFNYKHLDKALKIAALFFLVSTIFDWLLELTKIAPAIGMVNNYPLLHLFTVVSIIFFAAIYYYAFFNPVVKRTVLILSAVALLLVSFNSIFIEGIWEYPSSSITVLCVLNIFLSLAYFYQLLTRQEFIHIEKQGLFWINAGVLFYFSINIFLFMLFERINSAHKENYYMIHIITNIIANLLYTTGLLCKPQKTT
jgi:hypothetical protein